MLKSWFWFEVMFLVGLGNAVSLISWWWGYQINSGPLNIGLAIFLYAYVCYRIKLSLKDIQIQLNWKSLGMAGLAGLGLSVPPLVFFLFPILVSEIDYTPIKTLTLASLLFRLLVEIPFLTALAEELLFRHYLYNRLQTSNQPAILRIICYNAAIFTAWHFVVVLRTVLDTGFVQNNFLLILSYVGSLASVFVGGSVFAFVRYRTGHFYYAAFTHWLNVAFMTLLIWLI